MKIAIGEVPVQLLTNYFESSERGLPVHAFRKPRHKCDESFIVVHRNVEGGCESES